MLSSRSCDSINAFGRYSFWIARSDDDDTHKGVTGSRPVPLGGKYRALLAGELMAVEWVSPEGYANPFDLKLGTVA